MRKVKVESVEDLDALPDGEWVQVDGGWKVDWTFDCFELKGKQLDITLPDEVAKKLGSRHGSKFKATLKGRHLIVEK